MIIEKVMNNNCVQASMNGQEVIISGPGVGYNKKYGMSVPEHPANRIFYVRNEQKNKLYKLIEHVDIEYVFVAEKIVQYAENNLEKNLNPFLLIIFRMQYPESLQAYKLIMFSLMKSKRCTKQSMR